TTNLGSKMALSIKKIFNNKEEKETVEEAKLAANNAPKEDENSEKKIKHNTPSGCCGSCS
ncbi:CCGSCS motif protein, partial [Vibrio makurazakiensis]|uniref:CCGSCS motif protein n=1 Tax=Vibrio makurazakiensis TaxID=2910250 RepID=UPI003D145F74